MMSHDPALHEKTQMLLLYPNTIPSPTTNSPGAYFNKEVQPTLSLNLNSELTYREMGNSELSVSEPTVNKLITVIISEVKTLNY